MRERLEKLGPRYNALALPLTQVAVKRAKQVDDDLKRERFRGPLQGIPFGAKDLLAFAGHPTTWGAKPYATQVFDETATVLQKLDKTGSVLIGKLSMVELAGGGGYRTAAASLFGPGLNPWDPTCWSGGSSSGSGSAVAAGLVPFALGSETSGSIITPAAYCGITGLAADLWAGQPPRRDGALVDHGQDRPDVPQRRRLRAGSAGHRGLRFEGPGIGRKKLLLHAAVCAEAQRSESRVRARRYGMGGCRGASRVSRPPCR